MYGALKNPRSFLAPHLTRRSSQIVALQSAGRVFETAAMVGTLFSVIIGSTILGFGEDVAATATFAQALTTAISIPIFFYSYVRFEERPALNKTGGNIFVAGWVQLFTTAKTMYSENRYLFQYLCGLSFCDGANGNVFVLFPIYAMLQVKLENPALFTGLAMIVCIPGALLTKRVATNMGIRKQLGNILLSNAFINATLAGLIYQEGNILGILIVSLCFGLTIGGTYPMQKGMYMRLIPAGQEVEYQGGEKAQIFAVIRCLAALTRFLTPSIQLGDSLRSLPRSLVAVYNFFSQILGPLPSAWFVFCEDNAVGGDDSMRVGMLALIVFYLAAFLLMSFFMNEEAAIEKIKGTLHKRIRPTKMVGDNKVSITSSY